MFVSEEIIIRQSIMHSLDGALSLPILSSDEMPSSYESKEYLASHIVKLLNSDGLKDCEFAEGELNHFMKSLEAYKETDALVPFSTDVANRMFSIMSVHPTIPDCDLAVVQFDLAGEPYLGILKLDYKMTYTHSMDADEGINTIAEYKTAFPSPTQMIHEGIVINLRDLEVRVLERKHELDGVKDFYMSKRFLQCSASLSSKEQMKILKTTVAQLSKKFYEHNPIMQSKINQNLYEVMEDGVIDLEEYAEITFDNEEIKEAFLEKLEKKDLEESFISLDEKTINANFSNQVIKSDNGIEIKIPMILLGDSTVGLEVNSEGKITVSLKDIDKLIFK